MTDETYEEEYENERPFLNWFRDEFASWLSTFWLYILLWGIVLGAFGVLMYFDGKFSRNLFLGAAISPLAAQIMGWVFRFFAAVFLMAVERNRHLGINKGRTINYMGFAVSVLVCLHAVGFGLEALSDRRDGAMANRAAVEVVTQSNDDLIAALEARKATIDTDTAAAVAALDAEIKQYITDGLNNDDLADESRARRTELQDAARADKKAIDDQILELIASGAEQKSEGIIEVASEQAWAPLFVGLAQIASWSKEPTDWVIYLCGVGFIIFWVFVAEAIVIFLPAQVYKMHLHDAANSKGRVKVKFTEEEYAEWKAAYEEKQRRTEGQRRYREQRAADETIKVGNKEWAREKREQIIAYAEQGLSMFDISERFGWELGELTNLMGKLFTAEQMDEMFKPANDDEDEQPPLAAE